MNLICFLQFSIGACGLQYMHLKSSIFQVNITVGWFFDFWKSSWFWVFENNSESKNWSVPGIWKKRKESKNASFGYFKTLNTFVCLFLFPSKFSLLIFFEHFNKSQVYVCSTSNCLVTWIESRLKWPISANMASAPVQLRHEKLEKDQLIRYSLSPLWHVQIQTSNFKLP